MLTIQLAELLDKSAHWLSLRFAAEISRFFFFKNSKYFCRLLETINREAIFRACLKRD